LMGHDREEPDRRRTGTPKRSVEGEFEATCRRGGGGGDGGDNDDAGRRGQARTLCTPALNAGAQHRAPDAPRGGCVAVRAPLPPSPHRPVAPPPRRAHTRCPTPPTPRRSQASFRRPHRRRRRRWNPLGESTRERTMCVGMRARSVYKLRAPVVASKHGARIYTCAATWRCPVGEELVCTYTWPLLEFHLNQRGRSSIFSTSTCGAINSGLDWIGLDLQGAAQGLLGHVYCLHTVGDIFSFVWAKRILDVDLYHQFRWINSVAAFRPSRVAVGAWGRPLIADRRNAPTRR
jgi:hypothetical protein